MFSKNTNTAMNYPTETKASESTATPIEKSPGDPEIAGKDSISTRRLLRRIDLRLVPVLSALYLLCFLCRQNIANAKTYHMVTDLGISMDEYQLALTVFFFTYSTFDIPCNLALKKLSPRIWLPLVVLASGVVTVAMGIVHNAGALIATRLLLGLTECGLFPGVSYVITLWYRKKEAQFRQALFFGAASMAGAFSGLLAVGLAKMDGVGALAGWRWIMIIEGLLTVVIATGSFFIVLDLPERSTFLSAEEKDLLVRRLEEDEFGDGGNLLSEEQVAEVHASIPLRDRLRLVLTDWRTYAHIMIFYGVCCPLYSISLCLPSIVKDLGYTSTQANLLTIPIYITACLLSILNAYLSDRLGRRSPFLAVCFVTMFLGFLLAAVTPLSCPSLAYAGVFIAACGLYPAFPGMITWCSNNQAGKQKRAMGMAFHIGMGSFGGAMAPNFYRLQDAPFYRLGHSLNVGFVVLGAVCIAAVARSYEKENRRREKVCERMTQKLETRVEDMKRNHGDLAAVKNQFTLEKEMSLAREGDRSVWFRYTL